ncbi:MAG: ribosomal protein S18-alanine N-acetyltransferase [Clostridia bacterium]|nr:ribosomal protein S18-alanine N-acetyltransferase [Clostridia bacterium]
MLPRKLTAADAPSLAVLERACFSEPWSEDGLREELANPLSSLWGVECGGEIVAYGGWQNVAGEGYVLNIGVLPAFRRRGLGACVMQKLLEEAAATADFLTLEVRAGNIAAISLYEKLGFETVGKRRDFYRNPTEDAILMTKFFK